MDSPHIDVHPLTELVENTVYPAIEDFIVSFIVYVSHLTPVFRKQKDKIKYHEMLSFLKINLDPGSYMDIVNDDRMWSFFRENIIPFIGNNVSKNKVEDMIFLFPRVSNKPISDTSLEFATFLMRSIYLECGHEMLEKKFDIRPRVVTHFCSCPIYQKLVSSEKQNNEKTSLIDRRNSEIKRLKVMLSVQGSDFRKELYEVKERLDRELNEARKALLSLNEDFEKMKAKADAKQIRKARLNELKNAIKRHREDPTVFENYDKIRSELEELTNGLPVCGITHEKLHEIHTGLSVTKCGHIFSKEDLDNWFKFKKSEKCCPRCRTRLPNASDIHPVYLS